MSHIDEQLPHNNTSFSPEKSDLICPRISHGQGMGCHPAITRNLLQSNPAPTVRQLKVLEGHHIELIETHKVSQKKHGA